MEVAGNAQAGAECSLNMNTSVTFSLDIHNVYEIECTSSDGKLRWRDTVNNLVPTAGKNDLLTKYFKGSSYTATWYVGLISGSTPVLALTDTAAQINGSNAWTENTHYSEGARQTLALGTAASGSISNTASKSVFTINADTTIGGVFMSSVATKSATTGVLYGAALFPAERSPLNGDTVTITITLAI